MPNLFIITSYLPFLAVVMSALSFQCWKFALLYFISGLDYLEVNQFLLIFSKKLLLALLIFSISPCFRLHWCRHNFIISFLLITPGFICHSFSSFSRWKHIINVFLVIQAFKAINFPLRIGLAASCKMWHVMLLLSLAWNIF